MSLDIERLRRLSEMARSDADDERSRALAEETRQEEVQRQGDELKARLVILQIPSRTETEANAGRNHAIVMGLEYDDYDRPSEERGGWNICRSEWLKGASKLVYGFCLKEGFEPTIEHWDDGVGVKSGFNIVVHW